MSKRILHINSIFIRSALHQTMIEHLDETEYESSVFVPMYRGDTSVVVPRSNVCLCECFNKADRVLFDYKQSKIIKAVERQYDISSFDLIHAYTLFTDGNCARVLSQKYNIPYVTAVRDTDINVFFRKMKYLRQRGVRNLVCADNVFFLSRAYRDLLLSEYVPHNYEEAVLSKSHIVPNGIDPFWFTVKPSAKRLEGTIKLISVGQIIRRKNFTGTMAAVEQLRKSGIDASLTVVGRVVDDEVYRQILDDKNTVYHEPVSKEELYKLYRQHDIFVLPSHTETFGLVYAEALASGLPVIYTKGQGFDTQLEEGIAGYHVDSRSSDSICSGIRQVISEYDSLAANAPAAAEKFEWNRIVQKYLSVYNEICGKRSGK